MGSEKHMDSMAEHAELEEKGSAPSSNVLPGRHDIIDRGGEAVLLSIEGDEEAAASNLKLATDGRTVLVPQPSDDPNDPLNWSWFKKHAFLITTALCTSSCDFGITLGVPAMIKQADFWNTTPDLMNHPTSLCVAMSGIGGLLVIPPSYYWGRAPVLFWTTLIATMLTLGIALTNDFTTFYALRALQGAFITTCNVAVLCYIKDIFFYHEHARKIGIWFLLYFTAPSLGPMCGSFIVAYTPGWRGPFWLSLGYNSVCFCLILAFIDETWYRRDIKIENQPPRGHRIFRLLGSWQIKHHNGYFLGVTQSYGKLLAVISKPVILLAITYYGITIMWGVGINNGSAVLLATSPDQGGYGFGVNGLGFIYFAPTVGVMLGEFAGHFLNDWFANRYVRRHKGVFKPEARLPVNFIAAIFLVPGLVLVGQTLEHRLHWAGIVFGWGTYNFGIILASVSITAYTLDCYPNGSGEVSAWLNLFRTGCGMAVPYFQLTWGLKVGFGESFGVQAAVVVTALLLLVPLFFYGEKLRIRYGALKPPGSS